MNYSIGDKVVLNSGGPVMTVTAVSPRGKLLCEWENAGFIEEYLFLPVCLTAVP